MGKFRVVVASVSVVLFVLVLIFDRSDSPAMLFLLLSWNAVFWVPWKGLLQSVLHASMDEVHAIWKSALESFKGAQQHVPCVCPGCQNMVDAGSVYCMFCGISVHNEKWCGQCHSIISNQANYCSVCGVYFEPPQQSFPPPASPLPTITNPHIRELKKLAGETI